VFCCCRVSSPWSVSAAQRNVCFHLRAQGLKVGETEQGFSEQNFIWEVHLSARYHLDWFKSNSRYDWRSVGRSVGRSVSQSVSAGLNNCVLSGSAISDDSAVGALSQATCLSTVHICIYTYFLLLSVHISSTYTCVRYTLYTRRVSVLAGTADRAVKTA
jgi:hypothetical protein